MKRLYLLILFVLILVNQQAWGAQNGHLDPTFGLGGGMLVGFNDPGGLLRDEANAMVRLPDGRIYLAGAVYTAGDPPRYKIGITRLSHDGVPDEGFGQVTYLDPSLDSAYVTDAVFQQFLVNGKLESRLVVVGHGIATGTSNNGVLTCRFYLEGDIDPSFGSDETPGCRFIPNGQHSGAKAVIIDGNRRILMAGYTVINGVTRGMLARLTRDGGIDTEFGQGGISIPFPIGAGDAFEDLAFAPESSDIIVVGSTTNANNDVGYLAARLGPNGIMSGGWAFGYQFNSIPGGEDVATAVQTYIDGRILISGSVETGNNRFRPGLIRLMADSGEPLSPMQGGLGNAFGRLVLDNPFCTNNPGCDLRAHDMLVMPDGEIVVTGMFMVHPNPSSMFVAKLLPNGNFDNSFGNVPNNPGWSAVNFDPNLTSDAAAYRIATQGNRLLLAGYGGNGLFGGRDFAIARLDHGLNQVFTVAPSVDGIGGTISPDFPQVVVHSGHAQFTLAPDAGYSIQMVNSDCGEGGIAGNVYVAGPIFANCYVKAKFIKNVTLTYNAGENGTLTSGDVQNADQIVQSVTPGEDGIPVEAGPDPGFEFYQWSDGNEMNPRTDLDVTQDKEVTAKFIPAGAFLVTGAVSPPYGGTILPNETQFVLPGGYAQFEILPNLGYAIGNIEGNCGGSLAGNIFTTDPVTQNCNIQVLFVPSDEEFLLTYIAGPGGSINGLIEQQVMAGGSGQPVTADPDPGYFFVKWSDGSTQADRVDANVVADITVTAEFAPVGTSTYIVTPTWEAGGALWPGQPFPVVEGSNAILTVKPNPGFAIQSVEGCDGVLVGNQFATAPVTQDCEVHATFMDSNEVFTLTYTAGPNGQVNGQAQVQLNVLAGGQGIEVEAQPADGHFFVQWSDGSTDNPRLDANVAANIDVTAQFAADGTPVYEVTPSWSLGGALSPPVKQHIAEGESAKFTVVPAEGYAILSIGGTCGGTLVGKTYTTDPVNDDCTVVANFVASGEIFTLTYIAGPNGLVNNQAMVIQNVLAGGTADPVQATPAPGFFFLQWSDGWQESLRQDANIIGDLEVTAQFAQNGTPTYFVTPVPGPGGTMVPGVPLEVVEGGVAQFTIVPNDGFAIGSIGGTCTGTLEGDVFTTDPVSDHCAVEVSFSDDVTDRIFYNGFGFDDEQE